MNIDISRYMKKPIGGKNGKRAQNNACKTDSSSVCFPDIQSRSNFRPCPIKHKEGSPKMPAICNGSVVHNTKLNACAGRNVNNQNLNIKQVFKSLPPDHRDPSKEKSTHSLDKLHGTVHFTRLSVRDARRLSSNNSLVPMARLRLASNTLGRIDKLGGTSIFASAFKLREKNHSIVERLMIKFGLYQERVVKNIVVYTKSLVVPQTSVIDMNTFTAQMIDTFGISDMFIIERIFSSNQTKYVDVLEVEEYASVICTFATPILSFKSRFAFNIYDLDEDGKIEIQEFRQFLRPCIQNVFDDGQSPDDFHESSNKNYFAAEDELATTVLKLFGKPPGGHVSRIDFYNTVKKEEMLLQCLGQCLPVSTKMSAFMEIIENKNSDEITNHYANERNRCLREPADAEFNQESLYPIVLEWD